MVVTKGIESRKKFCDLIDQQKLKIGAEIGVAYGKFSEFLLKNSKLELLVSVDPFDKNITEYYCDGSETAARLLPYGKRSTLIKATGAEASKQFSDSYFDFIYIDGDHRGEIVTQDLEAWYPKLKTGGIFAGHDYCDPQPGVKGAVNGFIEKNKIETIFTTGIEIVSRDNTVWPDGMEGWCESWYFFKP